MSSVLWDLSQWERSNWKCTDKQEPEKNPPIAQTKLQKPAGAAQRKQYLKQETKAHHQI